MPLTPDLQKLAARVSNWGRWGDDDQRGTLNLISPEVAQRAVASARQGRAFSLAIPADDLDHAVEQAGVHVSAGDAVLVRTGQMHFLRAGDRQRYSVPSPGLSTQTIGWMHDHDVAAVATDTLTFEVYPCEDAAVFMPVHMIQLRDMGLVQGQNWHLDDLAADCADDGQ